MGRRVCMGTKKGWYGKKSYRYATHITIGHLGDVSPFSFVKGSLDLVLENQQYIATKVKENDMVELILNEDNDGEFYEIHHKGRKIGRLSSDATRDFREAINKTDVKANIPPYIKEVYVTNIVTIVPREFPSGVDLFYKESGIWLGVELSGFGKIDWHFGEAG